MRSRIPTTNSATEMPLFMVNVFWR
jgi:hypothetical protein